VVTALADPEPRPRMIDRCLVAAFDAGLRPLLCLTKSDLAPASSLLNNYGPLGVDHVVINREAPLDELRAHLHGRVSVLVGHSGVGKSTMVNALVPGAARAIGTRGVGAMSLRDLAKEAGVPLGSTYHHFPGGKAQPGVRSFGLAHVDLDRVIHAFPDLAEGTAGCPRSCSHDEPECALDDWVAAGHSDPARLASLRRLLRSRDAPEDD